MNHHQKLSIVFLLICLFHCSEGYIRCYSCSSTIDKRCGDAFAFTSPDAADCPGTCVKRRGTRDVSGVRTVEVTRGCVGQENDGCYDSSYNGISVYVCSCNTDYCNSSSRNHVASYTVITMVLFTMFKWLL